MRWWGTWSDRRQTPPRPAGRYRRGGPRWLAWGALATAMLLGPGLVELVRLRWRQRSLDRELAALRAQQEQLAAERTRLETDPAYMEGLIRTTFKQSLPGELVIPLESDEPEGKSR